MSQTSSAIPISSSSNDHKKHQEDKEDDEEPSVEESKGVESTTPSSPLESRLSSTPLSTGRSPGRSPGRESGGEQHREFMLRKESDQLEREILELLDAQSGDKKCVVVQFYINQIRKVDDVNQSADIDIYIKLNWRDSRWVGRSDDEFQEDENKFNKDVWWEPGVEITNGIELSKETPEEEAFWVEFPEHGILAYTQRCLGSISVPLDLHDFPFDTQTIPISFESFHWKADDMALLRLPKVACQIPPPPGRNWPSMSGQVTLADWEIEGITVKQQIKHYDFEDRDYSQILVEVSLRRLYTYYLFKILSILFVVVLMTAIAFVLEPTDLADRTGICVTLFLAAITFTFVISTSLPRIAYNTKMDIYLFVSYAFIVLTICENVFVYMLVSKKGDPDFAKWLDDTCGLLYITAFLCYTVYWIYSALITRPPPFEVRNKLKPKKMAKKSVKLEAKRD